MRYALDSNVVIDIFHGRGRCRERLVKTDPRQIGLPALVLYEIQFGLKRSRLAEPDRRILIKFLEMLEILPFDAEAARLTAELREDLSRQGQVIGPFDLLIAGTALAHGVTLVTHNTREFGRVAGLQVEDWY